MPDLLEKGRILFNRGQFYEAHEVWEDLWRDSDGPFKTFVQGLIQSAVGLHHLRQKNLVGAKGQIHKSIRNLSAAVSADSTLTTLNGVLDSESLIQSLKDILDLLSGGGHDPNFPQPWINRKHDESR